MTNNFKTLLIIATFFVLGSFVYFISSQSSSGIKVPTPQDGSIVGCYVLHSGKDVYTLNIQNQDGKNFSGIMAFNNYEKDSSSGSFVGTFSKDILLGIYSFDSEGMHSERQLVFKKVGDDFTEGTGPVKVVNDREVFEDMSQVNYDNNLVFVKTENCSSSFTDSNNVFTFNYHPYFQVTDGQGIPTLDWRLDAKNEGVLLARVSVPKTYLPKTNFSNAYLTIGRSTDPNAITSCTTGDVNGFTEMGTRTINGYTFSKFILSDAGAGNFYNTTSYRGIVDGDCYVIEYTIHSTNLGNYSPDQDIKEFSKSKIVGNLEDIVNSFEFLISSN